MGKSDAELFVKKELEVGTVAVRSACICAPLSTFRVSTLIGPPPELRRAAVKPLRYSECATDISVDKACLLLNSYLMIFNLRSQIMNLLSLYTEHQRWTSSHWPSESS